MRGTRVTVPETGHYAFRLYQIYFDLESFFREPDEHALVRSAG
jgi:hypothetical protein